MTFIYQFQNRNLRFKHGFRKSFSVTLSVDLQIMTLFSGRYKRLSRKHRQKIINSCFANNNFNNSVAFIKYKHNIVIPKEHGLVTNRQNHYSFTKHTQFPINLWPTSRTKHVTIIPILISNEFASVYISELENTINSLTSQAGCVEFLPISPAEVRSFTNWICIEPGNMI